MPNTLQSKSDNDKLRKDAAQERSKEQEQWHRLVVKVISWTDGLKYGGIIEKSNKITAAEWKTYCSRYTKTNTSHEKSKVTNDLEEIKKAIEGYGGFEKTN